MKFFTKKIFMGIVCLLLSYSAFSHGVQLRWGTAPSGAIRVWIEQWHGNQSGTSYRSFPLNVRYTVGGQTTYKTYYATGYINNRHWTQLPDNGNRSTRLSGCYNRENRYNDWVYWDFNPPACNTPVKLEIISGPSFHTTEACSNLYPQVIYSNFNDNTGPSLTCRDITVNAGPNCNAVVSSYNVSAVDACGGVSHLSYNIPPGSTFRSGTTGVSVTATDKNGNRSYCTFNVNVIDRTPPVVRVKDITLNLDANGRAYISPSQINNGSYDHCSSIASMSVSPSSLNCSSIGVNTVRLSVVDAHGNVGAAYARVTVRDVSNPVAKCRNLSVQLNASGQASIHPGQINAGSYDNCGIRSMILSKTSFDCSNVGPNSVTLKVIDAQGRTSACTAIVHVLDDFNPCCAAPVAKCKDIIVQLDANGVASISPGDIDGGSTAECGLASKTISKSDFDCSNIGANTVELILKDINGDVASCHSTVKVVDEIAPKVVTKNATIQLDANGQASITIADIESSSWDACGIADKVLSQTKFDCAHLGTNAVSLKVIDVNGNVTVEPAEVRVEDLILPTISCPSDIHIIAQPEDCNPVVSWKEPVADDNCEYSVSSTHQPGDAFPVGTTTVTYVVTDKAGNKASCSFKVTVEPTPLEATISAYTYAGGWNVSCNGASDGEATVDVDGGCLDYSYIWSDGQAGATANGLPAGTHEVKITDANGTVIVKSITLTEPPVLTIDGGANQTVYYGYAPQACTTLTATSAGGTPVHAYLWSTGETTASITVCPSETTIYTVTVTDANRCEATDEVKVCAIDVRCEKGGRSIVTGQGDKVMITHVSGNGKNTKYKTLCISHDDVADHLAHGDLLGEVGTEHGCDDDAQSRIAQTNTGNTVSNFEEIEDGIQLTAFPNPFYQNATIRFALTGSDHAILTLYSITGKEIQTLYNDWMEGGQNYEVRLNRNNLPHGIYFYQLRTQQGKVITNKLILSKSESKSLN